jgi:transposase
MSQERFSVPKFKPGNKVHLNPDYIALWESYLDEGMSRQHVAEIFGVARSTVGRHYPDKGWTPEEQLKFAQTMRAHNRRMAAAQHVLK